VSRPPDLRIDDLAAPRLPPELLASRPVIEESARALVLEVDALCEQAARETGLDDFGEAIYREPLTVLLEALDRDPGLSPLGRVSTHAQLLQFLKNRLLFEDLWKREPGIRDIPIEAPIVIAGLPRTGTTHLHNLLAADPALRSLPWWEALEPVPPLAEQGRRFDVDPRIERAAAGIAMRNAVLPHFDRMHDMYVDHVHEEIHLLAIAGSTMFFETLAPLPAWREWYLGTDQTPWYAYLKRILQALVHLRGGRRWVLKSPQHLEQFGPLLRVFPDAVTVVTHRDPVSITASFATMIGYGARMSRDPVDPPALGRYWADRIERMLRACVADRAKLPAQRSIDVRFDEFMRDDVAMVRRIFDLADQPFTPSVEAAMQAFMKEHPRGKHGRVAYDLADFDLDRAERRRALQFYVDHFGVALEEPET
jgi:hypothetical protein